MDDLLEKTDAQMTPEADFGKNYGEFELQKMWASSYNTLGYKNFVPVAQLDRALASGARGCAFESHRG